MNRLQPSRLNLVSQRAAGRRAAACLMLLVGTASCVPLLSAERAVADRPAATMAAFDRMQVLPLPADAPPPAPEPMTLQPVSQTDAETINASIPIAATPNPRADSMVFRAQSAWDQQRSLQCLAEAIYYEARSETEDGQRAVAQVVLNRVRHPAFPKSVCGVVYQGPQRAGGGCQFTFTCDGSLTQAPAGLGWIRARRIAAEALAGSVYGPVGYATNYHTQQVVPIWAFRLVKSAVIGAHSFYRLPGAWGGPGAFRAAYVGREPAPSVLIASRAEVLPVLPTASAHLGASLNAPPTSAYAALPEAPRLRDDRLPDSQVREEFRTSGQWLDGAATR